MSLDAPRLELDLTNPKATAHALQAVIMTARQLRAGVLSSKPSASGGLLLVQMPPKFALGLADALESMAVFTSRALFVANQSAALGQQCYEALRDVRAEVDSQEFQFTAETEAKISKAVADINALERGAEHGDEPRPEEPE